MSQWRRRETCPSGGGGRRETCPSGGGGWRETRPSTQEGDCSCEALEKERKELGMAGQGDSQDLLT